MEKLVVISFGNGEVSSGFPSVRAQLWDANSSYPIQVTGSLPAAPDLAAQYRQWQLLYLALHHRLGTHSRIKVKATGVTNVSEMEFEQFCQHLSNHINSWLASDTFRPIEQQLRTWLNASDEIRFIIETNDPFLQQLPWHLWQFLIDYPQAEIALSVLNYQRSNRASAEQTSRKVRILAILGDSQDIDVSQDRDYLEQLSAQADIHFLVEPEREELNHQLWQRWDMLFFAGHSATQETGFLQINPRETLTLEQLRWALNQAIANGLKLAIFNSCDGLGLAQSLADLHIPQVVVMREPIPDAVAQEFLKHFLTAFVGGRSLYTSVREARERLQGLEGMYPCASWLPVICQNPAEVPTTWREWSGKGGSYEPGEMVQDSNLEIQTLPHSKVQTLTSQLFPVFFTSLMVTVLMFGLRYIGVLQPLELRAYDHLMQLRPDEPPDDRLLIVTVTEDDFRLPEQQQRKGALADRALTKLLERLAAYKPRAIGLDIYRDFPVSSEQAALANQLRRNASFFAICKGSDSATHHSGIAPPPEVPVERQGFSDFVKDPDQVLRRHLLVMDAEPASPCTTPYALSVQLAFYALTTEKIPVSYTPQGELKAGQVIFKQLQNHQGTGYQQVDDRGYQILLNYRSYRSPNHIAPTVTLKQVLTNQIKPEDVRDRIILIGVTAPSAGDYLMTPYGSSLDSNAEMPGVIAHAQMVSQILSAVKDERPLIESWPFRTNLLWIWGWAGVGGILIVCSSRSRIFLVLSIVVCLGVLYLSCLYLLIQGKWVPLIPSALALVTTGGIVSLSSQRESEDRYSFR